MERTVAMAETWILAYLCERCGNVWPIRRDEPMPTVCSRCRTTRWTSPPDPKPGQFQKQRSWNKPKYLTNDDYADYMAKKQASQYAQQVEQNTTSQVNELSPETNTSSYDEAQPTN